MKKKKLRCPGWMQQDVYNNLLEGGPARAVKEVENEKKN